MSDFWIGPDSAPETYQLISLLGGGGEGEVWRANLQLSGSGRRTVAVKILASTGDVGEAENWQRVGHLLSSLAHPGLVRVTDTFMGRDKHRPDDPPGNDRVRVVVMDYVEGPTVREWVDENPAATAATRLALLRTVASALDEMHSGNRTEVPVAHGDVKPANIIVSPSGASVLVDLGLTRLADAPGQSGRSNPYASPELRSGEAQATLAGDAFAFAVTLAQVLTGAPPPTDPQGFLDVDALRQQLETAPATRNRPQVVLQIVSVVTAPPESRPESLRVWLDATVDTLSQVTTAGVAADLGALPAATFPTPPPTPSTVSPAAALQYQPQRRRGKGAILASLVALLVLVGGGITAFALSRGGDDPDPGASGQTPSQSPSQTSSQEPSPSVSETPTATPSPSPSPTETETPSVSSSPSALPTDTQVTTTQWVNELEPIDEYFGYWEQGGYSTNGKLYPHSLELTPDCDASNGGDYWVEYDLARSWTQLRGVIGISDDSPSSGKMTWKIFGDSKLLKKGSQPLGTSTSVKVPVSGVLRLRVLVHDDQAVNDCPYPQSAMIMGDLELVA